MECWQSWHYIYNIGLEEKIILTNMDFWIIFYLHLIKFSSEGAECLWEHEVVAADRNVDHTVSWWLLCKFWYFVAAVRASIQMIQVWY